MMKTEKYKFGKSAVSNIRNIFGVFVACIALLSLASCNVEEFPEPVGPPVGKDVRFVLNLNFETDLPLYKEVTVTRDRAYDLRYQINAYRLQDNGKYDYENPSATFTYFNSKLDKLNQTYEVTLPEGEYKFVAFTDYVSSQNHKDLYYNTDSFADIIVNTKPYTGNSDYRDCFNGDVDADVSENGEATIEMTRPLGKYVVIATDAEGFYTRVIDMLTQRGEYVPPTAGAAAPVNLDDFTVRVSYQQYMPSEFNLFSNRAIDSAIGVAYENKLSALPNGEMEMTFDYVFVNKEETRVKIIVQVIEDKTGEVISSSPEITVPLMRSKLTIVRGEFLTSKSNPGMAIDPDFEGEYNIEIK